MIKINCCARCRHLIVIQSLSPKRHFFCKSKNREITSDDISGCKDFIYQQHKELDEESKKDFEMLYNLPYKEE